MATDINRQAISSARSTQPRSQILEKQHLQNKQPLDHNLQTTADRFLGLIAPQQSLKKPTPTSKHWQALVDEPFGRSVFVLRGYGLNFVGPHP